MRASKQAQRKALLNVLKSALWQVRTANHFTADNLYWGKSRGIMEAGSALGLITEEERFRIQDLIENASECSIGRPTHA